MLPSTNSLRDLQYFWSNIGRDFDSQHITSLKDFGSSKQLATGIDQQGQTANSFIKGPDHGSCERSNSSHQSHSSNISSEQSTYADRGRPKVKSRNSPATRSKSRTRRGSHSREGKPLALTRDTINISEPPERVGEQSSEAALVHSYLSHSSPAPVPISQISRLVYKRDGRGGRSPLHQACMDGHLAVVKGLINFGAPVNCKDDIGFTPAHYAARGGYIDILEVLKQHKADLTALGDSGDTLLHLAARKNHAGTCGWLLDNGIPIDAQGFKGRTALHCAAIWGFVETVCLLLAHGASVHAKDFHKSTAYDLAVTQGHPQVSDILKKAM